MSKSLNPEQDLFYQNLNARKAACQQRTRRLTLVGFTLVGAVVMSQIIPRFFTISLTPSLRYRLFFTSKGPTEFKTGDYVSYIHDVPGTKYRNISMIKRVGCDEGEELTIDDQKRYFCNGSFLGMAKEKFVSLPDQKPFLWQGKIPAGSFFPIGDHKDSFDGRYYGFIEKKVVAAKQYPIF